MSESIQIVIDAQNLIVQVNDAWDRLARRARMQELVGSRVLDTSFLEHLPKSTHRQLATEIFEEVRLTGRPVEIRYRPEDESHHYPARISPIGEDQLEIWIDPSQVQSASADSHDRRLVKMCSHCRRIRMDDRWTDALEATIAWNLMAVDPVPALSHGLCPRCDGRSETDE